jgi:alpha-galactosidase
MIRSMRMKKCILSVFILLSISCGQSLQNTIRLQGNLIAIEFDKNLNSRIVAGKRPMGEFAPSEFVTVADEDIDLFSFQNMKSEKIDDSIGKGIQYTLRGLCEPLQKITHVVFYDDFPSMAIMQVTYKNISNAKTRIDGWTNNHYNFKASLHATDEAVFWSYQSGSYEDRRDWVLPLQAGFKQENFMGMNATDYGGGTPVVDVWCKDMGIGVGVVEKTLKLVSLPVLCPSVANAFMSITYKCDKNLNPGDSLMTFRTFVMVHHKDYFSTLAEFRRFMMQQGISFRPTPAAAYEPVWCAWGYERDFTMKQIYGALPMARKLGLGWAVLDDGWQTAEGDWYLVKDKFPNGDGDMIKLVDKIHADGLKAKLWWTPMAVDPGTDLIRNHPDFLLLNQDGSKQDISWWDSYYLCPAYPPVVEYTVNLVTTFMRTWGFDGLKIDGQHLNGAPPCYNPAHHHNRPEESVEGVAGFFQAIYEAALKVNPNAVVEICPCGTAYAFYTMPFMNQPVGSDPESSWQVRLKGKTLKALMGPQVAYTGDHVELSDHGDDFASTVGIGGVIETKFTWPVGSKKDSKEDLTPVRETLWNKWISIYNNKMLPQGEYLGALYDIGFDRPEAHAIKKDGKMYYAFYADKYSGPVELRGLEDKKYQVNDYFNNSEIGSVTGANATVEVQFERFLLLEAKPL